VAHHYPPSSFVCLLAEARTLLLELARVLVRGATVEAEEMSRAEVVQYSLESVCLGGKLGERAQQYAR